MSLSDLRVILADAYPGRPDAVEAWIKTANINLDGHSPEELMKDGGIAQVFTEARRIAGWPDQPVYSAGSVAQPRAADTMAAVDQVSPWEAVKQPWRVAASGTYWEISGNDTRRNAPFHRCIAYVLPRYATSGALLFRFVGPHVRVVSPDMITAAREMVLVDAHNPLQAHKGCDQHSIQIALEKRAAS